MGTREQLVRMAVDRIGVSPVSNAQEMDRITEGRFRERPGGKQYAWCGDFATYILMLAGCHDGGALNRVALNGKWTPGDNIARLVRWAKGYNQFVDFHQAIPGDIIIFANNTGDHICFLESKPTMSGSFTTIDGNHGNVVGRGIRMVGAKPIRCCISVGMLIAQNVPGPQPGGWTPFPVPAIPVPVGGNGAAPSLPFPIGWHYRETLCGRSDWTASPWLQEMVGLQMFDGANFTADGLKYAMALPFTEASIAQLLTQLGGSAVLGQLSDMLSELIKLNGPRIASPTDSIQLGETYTDGVEELFNENR